MRETIERKKKNEGGKMKERKNRKCVQIADGKILNKD